MRHRFGVTVIGVWRGAGSRKLEPLDPDERLREQEVLLVAGADDDSFLRFAHTEA